MSRRRVVIGVLLAAALGLGLLETVGLGAEEDAGIRWRESLEEAQAEAEANGKPIFLVFRCVP